MPDAFVMIILALVFLAAGAVAGFWFGQQRGRADAAKSDDLRREFDAYREQVTSHFGKTAEHFQALGMQVRQLYDHMAAGADALCDRQATDQAIEFSATEALRTPGSGTHRSTDAEAEETPTPADEEARAAESAPRDYESPEPEPEAVAEKTPESFAVAEAGEDDPDKRSLH